MKAKTETKPRTWKCAACSGSNPLRALTCKACGAPKPFSRKGLHRLECQMCDGFSYATVATLEARGLPPCWCGETLQPTELELAMILGADESRPMLTYLREMTSVEQGQQSHVQRGHTCQHKEHVAALRVEAERMEEARARRLAGLGLGERLERDPHDKFKVKGRTRFALSATTDMPF